MNKLLLLPLFLIAICSYSQNFSIGHTTIVFEDPERNNREIETEIYYPASTAGVDVAPATGRFPVIVFGHGFVMVWSAYENLWEEFVPRGYIMAFPRTEGNILSTDHQQFGWDLEFLVTAMQAQGADQNSVLFNAVASETALMGHSMGGGAAFLAADSLCNNGNQNLKTLVGLAPAESTSNGVSSIASAAEVTVPSFVLSGVQDGVTPPQDHHIPMYNALASDCKTLLNITGGAHCYFANSNFNCDFGEGTSSTGISITRQEQHEITFDFVNLWLDYTLKADCNDFSVFNDSLNSTPRATFDQVCNSPISFNSTEAVSICQGDTYTFPDGTTSTSSTVHTSNLISVGGCDSIVETTLSVVSSFNTSESVTICSGDTYTFPDGTSSSIATTHSSILTSSGGCDSIIETILDVQSVDTNVSLSNGTLTANVAGASYQWIDCNTLSPINGATSQSFSPSSTGNYAVQITQNGCTENSNCHQVQVASVGEYDKDIIAIFPNPTDGLIHFESETAGQITLLNAAGRIVATHRVNEGNQQLMLQLSPGVYFWTFTSTAHLATRGRLVIH